MDNDLERYIDMQKVALKAVKRLQELYVSERAKKRLQKNIDQEEQVIAWLEELVELRKVNEVTKNE